MGNPPVGRRLTRTVRTLVLLSIGVAATAQGVHAEQRGSRAQEIDLAIAAMGLAAGARVAEIGAGDARYSFRFAAVVGPTGHVYVNELGASAVRRLRDRAERESLTNVTVVEGGVDDTNLPDGCCDHMMMRHVYHMMTDPDPMGRSFFRALKPGGTLLILEGDPQPSRRNAKGVPANRAGMGIDPQIVIDELTAAGFVFERKMPEWTGSDYALLFRKPLLGGAGPA